MRCALLACVVFLGVWGCAADTRAGEKEEAVMAGCSATASTGVGYAGCVAAGWAGQAINTCLTQPQKCWRGDGKKLLCSIGIGGGCKSAVDPAELIRVFPFNGGCEAIYNTGIYFSPDCQNLRGGGNTINAWAAPQAHWSFVRGMVVFKGCIITAFNSGIYKSCDGLNLGGGGNTVKLYDDRRTYVESMDVVNYKGQLVLRTKFHNNPYYCDPSGNYPGGGPGVDHCDHGTVTAAYTPPR
jgi:hypothetical protein